MKLRATIWFLSVLGWLGTALVAAEGTKLALDTYSGYFVRNTFEPEAAQSFLVIRDQEHFDRVFGVAVVMGDKSHRLPKDAFQSHVVVAAIKRGGAVWEFKTESATVDRGVVTLDYTASAGKSDTATFACPLIVSIPKGDYTAVRFVENRKTVKMVPINGSRQIPLSLTDTASAGGRKSAAATRPCVPCSGCFRG